MAKEQSLKVGNVEMDYITFGKGKKMLVMLQGLKNADVFAVRLPRERLL